MVTETAYQRLYSILRDRILRGEYGPGDRLPTEREIGKLFGVSRITTRHALYLLEQQGLVDRFPRRGTIVRHRRSGKLAIVDGDYASSVNKEIEGVRRSVVSSRSITPPSTVRDALGLLKSETCYVVERVDFSGDRPIARDQVFFPHAYAARLTDDLLSSVDFLPLWLEKEGLELSHIHELIEAQVPDDRTTELLDLTPPDAVMRTNETFYSTAGKVLILVETYYRRDRWQLVTTLRSR